MTQTECAYYLGISIMGFYKRCKYYEEHLSTKYETTTKEEKEAALKLMEKHIEKLKKFNIEFQEKLTDTLYRTCLYIVRHQDEIENEENLIWFSFKRKCKDLRYEKSKRKELNILDKPVYKNSNITFGDKYLVEAGDDLY